MKSNWIVIVQHIGYLQRPRDHVFEDSYGWFESVFKHTIIVVPYLIWWR